MKTPILKWDSIGVSSHSFYCLIIILFFSCCFNSFGQKAFPTAEGFGKNASGGRGGSVIKVTNLNDSGSGSLRQALQYTSGPRTIVFEVGGTITLNSVLSVTNGDVTVAGQTAPGDGILIKGSMVIIEDSNVIVRYIRFRPGNSAANTPDGLNLTAWSGTVENIIIDHCSISWADDENLDLRAVGSGKLQNVTIQNCIISEGGYGSLGGPKTFNKTYYKNFFAHNSERNITTNYPTNGTFDFEMINNLVYGYRGATGLALGSKYTILNNHYRESSQVNGYGTIIDHLTSAQNTGGNGTYSETYAYIAGNIIPNGTTEYSTNVNPYIKTSPYLSTGIIPINAIDVANDILPHVGASLPNRDAVDVRLINQYNNGNGTTTNSGSYPTIQGGTALTDSDNDGMPNSWENENGLNPNNASDRNIVQPDGYTNLEYYLNGMTLGTSGNQVSINTDSNTICVGEEVILTASDANSYVWDPNGETSTSITVSPTETTTYTVTGTHSNGNTTQDEITITVNTPPTANAGNDVSTCLGTAVTLTATGGSSYLWSNGATSPTINVNPNTTTTYSVEVTQNGCSASDDVVVTVNAIPNVNAGNDVTIYSGESTTLSASGADSYVWSTGETTQSITVSPNTTATYSVTGTVNGCEDTDTVTVFLVDDSVSANAGQNSEICEGESITLTASGGTTYQWSTGETTASISVNPNTTTTYTVTAISVSGNNSDSDDVTVTVNARPTANAGNDIETCLGTSVTLTATGGSSYLWSNGATSPTINVNPNSTTTYSVEVTQNGCSASDEVVVTVNAIPNVNAGNDVTIYSGESTTLSASGADSYVWSTGETTQSITVSPNTTTAYSVTGTVSGCEDTDSVTVTLGSDDVTADAGQDVNICEGETTTLTASGGTAYQWSTGETTASISVNPNTTTTYTVTAFSVSGNNSDSDDVTVTVNARPTANAGNDIETCLGTSVTLTATGGTSYLWSNGATNQSITVNPNSTTTYSVEVTQNGCSASDDVVVTVNALPNVNAGNDVTIYSGESTTLSASGADSYVWSTGETTQSITVSPNTTTAYSVTGTVNGCEDTDSVTVTLGSDDVTADAGQDVNICEGETTTLTASGGTAYQWSTGETTASISVNPNTTTTYTVTAFSVSGNNSDSDDVTVTVNARPTANAGNDIETCLGTSVTLTATGGTSYLWSNGATNQSITVNPNSTTTYSVEVTQNGCSASDDVVVTVNALPNVNAGNDVTIYSGESTTLSASGADSYVWSTGETTQSITVSPNTTTAYSVTGTVNGCEDTDSVTVTVGSDDVTADAGQDVNICEGETTTLTASGGTTYQWSTGETTASISVNPNTTTTYTVTAFSVSGNNSDSDDITVTVNARPTANAGNDIETCLGTSVTLTATGGTSYLWSNGATNQSITVNPNSTTTYSVEVTQNGCSASDDVVVTVNALPNVNAGNDVTISQGDSITLTASGGTSYSWSNGATGSSITVSPSNDTTYTVTGTINGCENTDSITVFVDTIQANAGENQTICNGYSTTLTATGGDSYLWSTGQTTQSINVSPIATSTYTVTVSSGNIQDEDDVTVFVNPNPNVIINNGSEVTILEGEYITLSASGANSYQWNNGATQANIAVNPSTTTTYTVTGYINNCSDFKEVIVNVVEPVIAYAGEDQELCLGEEVTLTATGGNEFLWSTGETTQSITVSPNESTEYSVIVNNELDIDEAIVFVSVADCAETELPDESEEFNFVVYPNPASSKVNIKVSGYKNLKKLYICDSSGKFLYKENFNHRDNSVVTREINTSKYSKGLYFLKLVYNDRTITKKLIVN